MCSKKDSKGNKKCALKPTSNIASMSMKKVIIITIFNTRYTA